MSIWKRLKTGAESKVEADMQEDEQMTSQNSTAKAATEHDSAKQADLESSVGRNSIIMATGTAASRVTGQIRTILLAAAIGTTGIAADAYQTGAMIPQVMFTLISGGIFNAVLVPQIVRTLKEEDAEERLDKLITASVALLAGITIILMLGTSVLTAVYLNSKWNPAQRALANAFTIWCMPQVFFYGLYTVLGQILAAKGRFTAYAWSSVGANVISCLGFIVFIGMFGNAQKQPMDFWSPDKVGLTAGAWTLGVAFQALILFIPLIRSGFTYRPRIGLKGIGLRSMGPVAAWSLGVVIIDQLANIVNARITNGAPLEGNPFDIAGNGSYQNAYTLYMLPYSLIAVSVSTAIFPRLSQAIAEGQIATARETLSRALRNVGLMMCFFSVVMLVIPVPIIRALIPSVNVHEATLIAGPLLGLTVGLTVVSAFLLIQRTFYAFEDGKRPFLFAAISNAIQVIMVLTAVRMAQPQYWTALVGLSMALSNILAFPLLVVMLKQRFEGSLDGKRILGTYAKAITASLVSAAFGLFLKGPVTGLVGAQVGERQGHMSWLQAVIICTIITLVISAVYVAVLYALRTQELIEFLAACSARLGLSGINNREAHQSTSVLNTHPQARSIANQIGRVVRSSIESSGSDEMEGALEQIESVSMPDISRPTHLIKRHHSIGRLKASQIVLDRYQLTSPLKQAPGLYAWNAKDLVLGHSCQIFIVNDVRAVKAVNTTAFDLALSPSRQFTPVYQVHTRDEIALIVTELDAGMSVENYLHDPALPAPSYEAVRTIIGESAQALGRLRKLGLEYLTISPNLIRLAPHGVTLADAPVLQVLAHWQPGAYSSASSNEEMTVRQLSGVLYALLTGQIPGESKRQIAFEALPKDVPEEFRIICMRGLGISAPETTTKPIPLVTLAELTALLGSWHTPEELTEKDITWPETHEQASIQFAPLKKVPKKKLLPITDSILQAASSSSHDPAEPHWGTNQLLFPESSEVELVEPSDTDSDLFSVFDEEKLQKSQLSPEQLQLLERTNRTTQAVDVSAIRKATLKLDPQGTPLKAQPFHTAKRGDAEGEPSPQETTANIIPPSFTPGRTNRASSAVADKHDAHFIQELVENEDADLADSKLFGRFTTRSFVITLAVSLLTVGLIWGSFTIASRFTTLTGTPEAWPQMSVSSVPGAKDEEQSAEAVQHTPKLAHQVPQPHQDTNTVAFPIVRQAFLTHPAGQDGVAWYVRLEASHEVSKMEISIRQKSGHGQIFANGSGSQPTPGQPLARFDFDPSGTTVVTFQEPVSTQDLIVWVPTEGLPQEGAIHFNSVKVY